MSSAAKPALFRVRAGDAIDVYGVTYYARRVDRRQDGSYRIEASSPSGEPAAWLIRGRGLLRDEDGGPWFFTHYSDVVRLGR